MKLTPHPRRASARNLQHIPHPANGDHAPTGRSGDRMPTGCGGDRTPTGRSGDRTPTGRSGGDRTPTGRSGEEAAARYLEAQGYEVLARNWRDPRGELDLVVRRGAELVIVEVRATEGEGGWRPPEQTVDRAKQAHVIGAARRWLRRNGLEGAPLCVRFDVIGVRLGTGEVVHLRGAFEA